MIRLPLPRAGPENESLYTGITTWARQAHPRTLLVLTAVGLAGAGGFAASGWDTFPVAGVGITLASIGAWGLLERRPRPGPRLLQGALAGLGILGAVLAGLGLLLWIMGPAPIL